MKPEHDLMVAWHMKPKGYYKYSVYSNNGNLHVGEICRKFGGGGRKGVGGFNLDHPFPPKTELATLTSIKYENWKKILMTLK